MPTPPNAIVVGLDGGPDSARALAWAIEEALRRHASLHAVHALPVGSGVLPLIPADLQALRDHADRLLAAARDTAGDRVPITTEVLERSAAPSLLDLGKGALMIVVGARGHGRARELLLGSVSGHVSRHAACPVVTVRAPADPRQDRIIVGVDGSPVSDVAIGFAVETAALSGAPVVAIHGWHGYDARFGNTDGGRSRTVARVAAAERMLEEAVAGWAVKFPSVNLSCEAIPRHPALVLADASEHAALVVVGARGHGEFAGMLLGSVSHSVLQHAQCPVAVVR
ncbi:universal stress protein [Pseudonocardia sp. GCM10023141]|uniref:universal stress protein n=1 Tax=Pseudonocardia sp. GCM10023141 TaxID=3252653 RepID=UPI00361375E6